METQLTQKLRIKAQMVKTVARLWNIPENEIETNFDPLVLLLIEACAAELEKIGLAIHASQSRLLDKLVGLIVPDALLGPRPASCIAVAKPAESVAQINEMTGFSLSHKAPASNGNTTLRDFFFTPVAGFTLFNINHHYSFIGKKIYKINENGSRELVHADSHAGHQKVDEICLAVEIDKDIKSLEGMSLFFDLRNYDKTDIFYNGLSHSRIFMGGKELKSEVGYFNKEQLEYNPKEMLASGYNYSQTINRDIAAQYVNRFIHITGGDFEHEPSIPEGFQPVIPVTMMRDMEKCVFLTIRFNRHFKEEELDGLACHLNAFPVVNRKINQQNYKTDTWINIVPLQVQGSFLDVLGITTIGGGEYRYRIISDGHNIYDGEAAVRSSGVGKTGSMEIRDTIGRLINSIRDENAYFTDLSNDFVVSRLKEINQILSRLEDQLSLASDAQKEHHYLLLKPKKAGETIIVQYFTTDGETANQIPPFLFLTPLHHSLTGTNAAFTITTTRGGKTQATDKEKKNILQRQLISKDKIVSAQDIKLRCRQLFGDNLLSTEVKKGVGFGASASQGLYQTIDILLELKDKQDPELAYLQNELLDVLKNHATMIYPFRIIIV